MLCEAQPVNHVQEPAVSRHSKTEGCNFFQETKKKKKIRSNSLEKNDTRMTTCTLVCQTYQMFQGII
jgi:hypothetical protein